MDKCVTAVNKFFGIHIYLILIIAYLQFRPWDLSRPLPIKSHPAKAECFFRLAIFPGWCEEHRRHQMQSGAGIPPVSHHPPDEDHHGHQQGARHGDDGCQEDGGKLLRAWTNIHLKFILWTVFVWRSWKTYQIFIFYDWEYIMRFIWKFSWFCIWFKIIIF